MVTILADATDGRSQAEDAVRQTAPALACRLAGRKDGIQGAGTAVSGILAADAFEDVAGG